MKMFVLTILSVSAFSGVGYVLKNEKQTPSESTKVYTKSEFSNMISKQF